MAVGDGVQANVRGSLGAVMTRKEHNESAEDAVKEMLGRELTETERALIDKVNARMDQFAHFPDPWFLARHRRFLHHREGVEYFGRKYGRIGHLTALLHVVMDCGHVPNAADYGTERVDQFGCRKGD